MDAMAARDGEGIEQTQLCEVRERNVGAVELERLGRTLSGTPLVIGGHGLTSGRGGGKLWVKQRKTGFTSTRTSVCGWRDRAIGKKVIGRSVSIFREGFSSESVFLRLMRTFPLLHQPARQHGGSILLEPLIEKRADLLAEIGGMAKT